MEGGTMELTIIDQLLICLVDRPRNVPMAMREAGHDQEEISAAWREASGSATPNRPASAWIV